ncbi:MAG: hypothetical protein LBR11_12975 [Deltaproteobacteria bacterium]|jgi:hypothetical protein|nr:hypothetical protein [Deltaproteobacteria bacterium]
MESSSKSNRNKIVLIILVIAAVAVGLFFFFQSKLSDEAYKTFETAMNQGLGQAATWEAGSHEFSLMKKTLTVNQVKVTVKKEFLKTEKPLVIDVAQVKIKNGPRLNELERLLGLTDWRSQKATHIFDELALSDIRALHSENDITLNFKLNSWVIANLGFLEAGPDQTPGPLGFLRSARLDSSLIDQISIALDNAQNPEKPQKVHLAVGPINLVEPHLADSPKDSPALDLSEEQLASLNHFKLLTSFSCQEFRIQNFKLQSEFEESQLSFSLEDLLERGMSSQGRVKLASLKNLDFSMVVEQINAVIKLGSYEMTDLDYSRFLQRAEKVVASLIARTLAGENSDLSVDEVTAIYGQVFTYANLFALYFDLGHITMTDFSGSINDALTFGISKFNLQGPLKAGRIPPKLTMGLSAYFNLPTQDNPDDKVIHETYKFGQIFGQTNFQIETGYETTYNPQTGDLNLAKNSFAIKDLFTLSSTGHLTGLTESLMADLDNIVLSDFLALFSVKELFNVGLVDLQLTLENQSLVTKIFEAIAQQTGTEDIIVIREMAKAGFQAMADEYLMAKGVTNVGELVQAVNSFLDQPQSLSVGASPSQAFTPAYVMSLTDESERFNALGLYLSVNQNKPIKLNWLRLDDVASSPSESQPAEEFQNETIEEEPVEEEPIEEQIIEEEAVVE